MEKIVAKFCSGETTCTYKRLQQTIIVVIVIIIIIIILTNLVGNIMVHSWISATPSIPLVLHLQIVVKILLIFTRSMSVIARVAEVAWEHGWHPPKSLDSGRKF